MEDEKIEFQTEEVLEKEEKKDFKEFLLPVLAVVSIVITGVASGYFLSLRQYGKVPLSQGEVGEVIEKGMVIGVDDLDVFRDTAEGVLEINDGSFTDEGTHKLVREGGESQTAYLISSVLDLDKLVGRKVKLWGETFTAQKAGWLMDVGKVEVLE